jgi:hypothetical protein
MRNYTTTLECDGLAAAFTVELRDNICRVPQASRLRPVAQVAFALRLFVGPNKRFDHRVSEHRFLSISKEDLKEIRPSAIQR